MWQEAGSGQGLLLSGVSPSASLKRDKLLQRNAILRRTGFIEAGGSPLLPGRRPPSCSGLACANAVDSGPCVLLRTARGRFVEVSFTWNTKGAIAAQCVHFYSIPTLLRLWLGLPARRGAGPHSRGAPAGAAGRGAVARHGRRQPGPHRRPPRREQPVAGAGGLAAGLMQP